MILERERAFLIESFSLISIEHIYPDFIITYKNLNTIKLKWILGVGVG